MGLAPSSKTIFLDGTPLTLTSGGIQRYTAELSRALRRVYPGDRFVLASDQQFPAPDASLGLECFRPARGWRRRRWWSAGLPLALGERNAAVFHGTDFSVPYVPLCASVMTVHDLSPWKESAWHHRAGRVRRRTPMLLRLGLATMVITPSRAVRREVIEHFGLAPARVVAVPLAAAEHFRPVPEAGEPGSPYFLYVGVLEPRKNISLLVEAWRQVASRHRVRLVLAGRRRSDFGELPEEEGLEVLGEVAESELPRLYSGATAMVYPTYYEGFGLPVLEAMQCGCAVVTSGDPAVGEVTGEAAIRLNSTDPREWADALEGLLSNHEELGMRRDMARRRSGEFSWERTARETCAVYVEAENRHGG